MADVDESISGSPAAGTLDGTELVPMVQGGVNVRGTAAAVAALGGGVGGLPSGTITGQLLVWDNTLGQWVVVTPSSVTAADVSADSSGFGHSTGATVQAVLADLDSAITGGGGGGGGGGTLVNDTFTRVDSASVLGVADTGQTWSILGGTWGIKSNMAYKVAAGSTLQEAIIESTAADCTVACTVTPRAGTSYRGVVLRAADANNLLLVQLAQSEDTVSLIKRVAGVQTTLATIAQTVVNGTPLGISVSMAGTHIIVSVGGVEKINYNTSTGLEANTKHGIWSYELETAGGFDNFVVTS